ncbi:MAG: glycosyltransferase family protein [Patescibacteria group bacterium]|nr:glycosyltransferase family protein [Patescibacteria group bacterium]
MLGAIIQARTGSRRLPGKVIKKIEGKTVLEHVIERVKRVKYLDRIILATTNNKEDDILERMGEKLNILIFRGSENDVLDRYYQAAKLFGIRSIIRITADCPLIDPRVVGEIIDFYSNNKYDYVSNVHPPTFPHGLDAEILNFKTLKKIWNKASIPSEREHVTSYITNHPETFKIGNVIAKKNFNHLRLVLDEGKDLTLIRKIYSELYKENRFFELKDILKLFENKPELIEINREFIETRGA